MVPRIIRWFEIATPFDGGLRQRATEPQRHRGTNLSLSLCRLCLRPAVRNRGCLHFAFWILNYDDTLVPTILTIADVERIAALAQLELTDAEKQLFTKQLADILAYAEQVQAIDTGGVPATAYVNAAQRTEREDEPRPCLSVEEAIANAPDAAPDAGLFRVPRVIGG
jgi:aspartyl-tRNA(Asn)/glutamyl-tRNA(Gln) amidotransferase subunit C